MKQMSISGLTRASWPLALLALPVITATMLFASSISRTPWLDEFFSLTLMQARNPAHLAQGIYAGIDCNPPLYHIVNLAVVNLLPSVPVEVILRTFNFVLFAGFVIVVYRIIRRFASPAVAVTAVLIGLISWTNLFWIALEMRSYMLFLLTAAWSLDRLLCVLENRNLRNWTLFAVALLMLALSHTFGTPFALAIAGGAGLVSLAQRDWPLLGKIAIAASPTLIFFALWTPVILNQSTLAVPYGWITEPQIRDIIDALYATKEIGLVGVVLVLLLGVAAATGGLKGVTHAVAPLLNYRGTVLVVCGALFVALTLFVWVVSKFLYPVFVDRYFIPNMLFTFGVAAVFAVVLFRTPFVAKIPPITVAVVLAIAVSALYATREAPAEAYFRKPCVDDDPDSARLRVAERHLVDGLLPVVTESPQAWVPRREIENVEYILGLDWDVVINYPFESRSNAVDYNIMSRARDWGDVPNILETSQILDRYPEFLVLHQPGYSWLTNLRATQPVTADKIGDVGDCELWRVRLQQLR